MTLIAKTEFFANFVMAGRNQIITHSYIKKDSVDQAKIVKKNYIAHINMINLIESQKKLKKKNKTSFFLMFQKIEELQIQNS